MSPGCIFCKIIAGEIPSTFVYETPELVAFRDINPQAPVHVLVVSRKHIVNVNGVTESAPGCVEKLVAAAGKVASDFKIQDSGYRLVVNCNRDGGQTVDHLHVHLLGGRPMHWPPG